MILLGNCFGFSSGSSGVTPIGIMYQRPMLTGQTTIYRVGDAGWQIINNPYSPNPSNPSTIQTLVNFTTLGSNNAFGNNNRFTDDTGGQIYANNYIIDHYTGIGWYNNVTSSISWNTAIDAAQSSNLLGYIDWKIPNVLEVQSIFNYGVTSGLNYGIFTEANTGVQLWTSNTDNNDSSYAMTAFSKLNASRNMSIVTRLKTDSTSFYSYMFCRNHY